jgi:hypothetical protein
VIEGGKCRLPRGLGLFGLAAGVLVGGLACGLLSVAARGGKLFHMMWLWRFWRFAVLAVLAVICSGRGWRWVAALQVSARFVLADFFVTFSHCPWRDFISFSKRRKRNRSKENAFQPLILK